MVFLARGLRFFFSFSRSAQVHSLPLRAQQVRHHHHRGQWAAETADAALAWITRPEPAGGRLHPAPAHLPGRSFCSLLCHVTCAYHLCRDVHALTHSLTFALMCLGSASLWPLCAGAGAAEPGAQLRARVRRKGVSTHHRTHAYFTCMRIDRIRIHCRAAVARRKRAGD